MVNMVTEYSFFFERFVPKQVSDSRILENQVTDKSFKSTSLFLL